ncbi:hypothetical protein J3A83DRAFT_4185702 [Scleroderma citrinum]
MFLTTIDMQLMEVITLMGPSCNTQGKYNYSEEMLSGLHKCQLCGKQFKVQGIKKHKASCKKQQELQEEQAWHVIEFKRESCQPTLFQKFEEFSIKNKTLCTSAVDSTPWKPLKTQGNHHFAEIALDAGLNKVQVDDLLTLFTLISQGKEQVTITTNAELQKFSKHVVSAPYKGKSMEFESQLPNDVENAVPFCFILYADKTKLSSHGTVKGYPIVVQCANLPVDIQNSQNVGGGCVVGLLPIIPEDLEKEGKLGYTTLKCVVWHESTLKLFEVIIHFSKASFEHHCWDAIIWYLFPLFLILFANYDEYVPCPIRRIHDLLKTFALHNAGQGEDALSLDCIPYWYSDPYLALSFDFLHSLHLGLWGKHLFEDLKIILRYLRCGAEGTVEGLVKGFPHWHKLSHFKAILKVSFSNGNKLADLSIQVFYAALNVLTHAACPSGHLLVTWSLQLKLSFLFSMKGYRKLIKIIQIREMLPARNGEHSNNDNDNDDLPLEFEGHFKLGSSCKPSTIQEIKMAHDTKDKAYFGF